ncbi:MAG: M6 family metalloprotease domain-containing protein [Muribaculaceae bacterium]|nr:M6 family metalloprotease domain-containing protein [Muribaculaceae bacterium]
MKKYILHKITVAAAACALAIPALAIPAKPGIMTIKQPDGTELAVQLRGDERHHCYFTPDGFPIVEQNGYFYYAKIDESAQSLEATAMRVSNVDMRTAAEAAYISTAPRQQMLTVLDSQAQKANATVKKAPSRAPQRAAQGPGLFNENNFPANGKRKAIVILVEYKDHKFNLADPHDYFSRMLMEPGFSDYGGTGSCHDFFVQNSKGQFDPEFDLYGPITLSQNRSYYGGNDWSGNDQHPEQMVIEACNQLDATVDFSQYDNNGDGFVDNIFVFYAGMGEANGGSSDTVWPHSWNITSGTYIPYIYDGVQIDKYGCSNEWEGGKPDGIGTFVHEFSHVMGLPDLYATSYTSSFTPGAWSALDYGPYNNEGCTPPNYGAFERYALGWMEPRELTGATNVRLNTIDNNEACIIKTSKDNEFFLFENRQQTGWDTFVPGHGMLVWHVDYNESVWDSNKVNNTPSHQYVDIEEADGTQTDYTRDGDAFPGTKGVTSFTDTTRPSMKSWNNVGQQKPITEITETNGIITFKVCGGLPDVNGVAVTGVADITPVSAVASWTADENASSYLVTCYSKVAIEGREDAHVIAGDWQKKDVGNVLTVTIDGLQPLTEYFVEVCSTNGADISDPSEPVVFTTAEPTFDLLTPVAVEASEVTDSSFVANWQGLDGAVEYLVDVYSVLPTGESELDVCDFADGVKDLPAGWVSSSKSSYANSAYSGQAVPSLRLTTDQAYVMSPTYADDICSISFWHRGSNVPEGNSIKVMASVGGQYVEIANVPVVNEAGGLVTEINDVPLGVRSVRIVYDAPSKAAIAIDDITIGHGLKYDLMPVVKDASAGAALSLAITGLEPSTEYFYSVVASDGSLQSKTSNTIKVVTLEKSSDEPTFDQLAPVALEATEVTDSSFVANWQAMDGAVEYFVSVYAVGEGAAKTPVLESASAGADLSMTVTGLSQLTAYVYVVTASDGTLTSLPSAEVAVATLEGEHDGIASATAAGAIKVDGKSVSIAAEPGQSVTVCDPQGRTLYRGITGADGRLAFDLLTSGIAILRVGNIIVKLSF